MTCQLDRSETRDILDVERGGHVFTDGCGLISKSFARKLVGDHKKKLNPPEIFQNYSSVYVPSVFQIRYKGYKGILVVAKDEEILRLVNEMQNPGFLSRTFSWIKMKFFTQSGQEKCKNTIKVLFRHSMKKFDNCPDNTFAILSCSKPGSSAKLNTELVTLLSTNGVPDDVFISQQVTYYEFVRGVSPTSIEDVKLFLTYRQQQRLIGKLDRRTMVPPWVQEIVQKQKKDELYHSFNRSDLQKVQIMIPDSRLLLGVSDTSGKLMEGECFVKYTPTNLGSTITLTGKLLVGRNPCLHPGDIQIFTAIGNIPELEHLVDCIVFNTCGSLPAPSLLSGGDLDGDKFFVSWDEKLLVMRPRIPEDYSRFKPVSQSKKDIGQSDMLRYFANYTNSLGEIMSYYRKWVRADTSERANSVQCKKLNALYSKCVDGERVDIPQKLRKVVPVRSRESEFESKSFVVDTLLENVDRLRGQSFQGFLGSTLPSSPPVLEETKTVHGNPFIQRVPPVSERTELKNSRHTVGDVTIMVEQEETEDPTAHIISSDKGASCFGILKRIFFLVARMITMLVVLWKWGFGHKEKQHSKTAYSHRRHHRPRSYDHNSFYNRARRYRFQIENSIHSAVPFILFFGIIYLLIRS